MLSNSFKLFGSFWVTKLQIVGSVNSSVSSSNFYKINAISFLVEFEGLSREALIWVRGDFSFHFIWWKSPNSVMQQKVIISPAFKPWKYFSENELTSNSLFTSKNTMCLKNIGFYFRGMFHFKISPLIASKSINKRLYFFLNISINFIIVLEIDQIIYQSQKTSTKIKKKNFFQSIFPSN